ncbi:mucin-16-like [Morphnus guianensis]
MTDGITKLGIYNLDNKSLYINGYNKPLERSSLSTTAAPSPTSRYFTLNFTLTNLQYTADLDAPSSHKFISTMKVINHYVSLALVLPILCYGGNLNLSALNSEHAFRFSVVLFFFFFDRLTLSSKEAA